MLSPLDTAIEYVGGVTQLARCLEVHQTVVSQWKRRGRVPPKYCIPIERLVHSRVTRYQLRPDVFDPEAA
ncbi:MAG: helix-turn-helix domain-containing protein [Bradyrhizobium sp.]|nr:helix-turn-helix domain-containing protein [Bradyrhizobium sp.]